MDKKPAISRDAFLAGAKREPQPFEMPSLGGVVYYRLASVGDRAAARKMATVQNVLQAEEFEAALVILCMVEPKLSEMDLPSVLALPATEINGLAGAITGISSNPQK